MPKRTRSNRLTIAALAAACFVAPLAFTNDAHAAPNWVRCTLTKFAGNGGDEPYKAISPIQRIFVFDEASGTLQEYIDEQLYPARNVAISAVRMIGWIRTDRLDFNRNTGELSIWRQPGDNVLSITAGSCAAIEPLKIRGRAF